MIDAKMKGILEGLGASLVDILKRTHGEIEAVSTKQSQA
jgi:hypothetical protein